MKTGWSGLWSHEDLQHEADGFSTQRTGVGTGSDSRPASLTEGKVTTREDQDTFLLKQHFSLNIEYRNPPPGPGRYNTVYLLSHC